MDSVALRRISWHLSDDKNTLSVMCIVCKAFNAAFSPELYRKLTISSVFDIRDVDRENDAIVSSICTLLLYRISDVFKTFYDKVVSSCLPRNVPHVQEFEVVGLFIMQST